VSGSVSRVEKGSTQPPQGLGADQDVLAVVQVQGVDAVELPLGVVAVLADVALQVLAVLLVGLEAQGVAPAVDGLADLPRERAGSLRGRKGVALV